MKTLNWRNKNAETDTPEAALKETFGLKKFRGMQRKVIGSVLDEENSLYVAPTGLGKSLCYQVPALLQEQGTTTVVTTPLIALMRDQVRALKVLGVPATALHSDITRQREDVLREIRDGLYALVYMSPEQLQKDDVVDTMQRTRKSFMAIDEAHCISQWGHDFRPAYGAVGKARAECGFPYASSFTATASPVVEDDIQRTLGIDQRNVLRENPLRKNLTYGVTQVANRHKKIDQIAKLIEMHAPNRTDAAIVYCGTREATDRLSNLLNFRNIRSQFYHGEMAGSMRRAIEERFRADSPRVLVATNAFGMGIDKPNIRLVIHDQFPGSVQNYLQETGRAGRDGKPARCELLYAPEDHELQEYFIERKSPPMNFVKGVYLNLQEMHRRSTMKPGAYFHVDLFPFYRLYDRKGRWDIETNELRVNSAFSILEQAGVIERPSPSRFRIVKPLEGAGGAEQEVRAINQQRHDVNRFHLDQMMQYAQAEEPSQGMLIDMLGKNSDE